MSASTANLQTDIPPRTAVTARPGIGRFFIGALPGIIMMVLVLAGVAYSSTSSDRAVGYWDLLVPVFAILCILAGLGKARAQGRVGDLIWTQILHWICFLAGMYLIRDASTGLVVNDAGVSLLQLMLLALGVLLAGIHSHAWRIFVVGIVLMLAVPAIAWINAAATLLTAGFVVLLLIVLGFWVVHRWTVRRTYRVVEVPVDVAA